MTTHIGQRLYLDYLTKCAGDDLMEFPRNRVSTPSFLWDALKSPLGNARQLSEATGRDSAGYLSAGLGMLGRAGGLAASALPGRGVTRTGMQSAGRLLRHLAAVYAGGAAGHGLAANRSNAAQDREFMSYVDDYLPDIMRTKAIGRQLDKSSPRGLAKALDQSSFLPGNLREALRTRNPVKAATAPPPTQQIQVKPIQPTLAKPVKPLGQAGKVSAGPGGEVTTPTKKL